MEVNFTFAEAPGEVVFKMLARQVLVDGQCVGAIILSVSNHGEVAYQADDRLLKFMEEREADTWMMDSLPILNQAYQR